MSDPARTDPIGPGPAIPAPTGDFSAGHPEAAPDGPARAGRYELGEPVGRGGMGAVYRARDPELKRDLAVKVLLECHRGSEALRRRFLEEARVTGQLQHPGVPPVHDVGALPDGRPFFAMKLVRGHTLAELLAGRPSPTHDLPRFVGVFGQVCQGVAYAHSKGVIHRDLKPANVMVGAFGEVQVMDWGLAKTLGAGTPGELVDEAVSVVETGRVGDRGSATQAGSVLGTFGYMPPEQATGLVGSVDRRSDVFGLGAVLCEVLTGRPPYAGAAEDVRLRALRADLADAFARLDASAADPELVALARRCLAPDPAGRPADAREVAEGVARYQAGVEDRARRAELDRAAAEARGLEARATAAAERRARRRAVGLGAALLLLLTGGGGAGWWLSLVSAERHARQERDAAERTASTAASLDAVASARDAGRWLEARAVLEQAERRLGDSGPEDLRGRLRPARADLELALALEDARLLGAGLRGDSYDEAAMLDAFAAAFERYGLPANRLPPEELADRVRGSAVAPALVAALDEWWYLHTDPAARDRLRRAAGLADPDGWREGARRAAAAGDREALGRLASDAGADRQPPGSLVMLARALRARGGNPEEAAALLRRARAARPDDYWVNLELGMCQATAQPPAVAEAEAGYRAALAVRPQSPGTHLNLGSLLALVPGREADAEAEFRQALRLSPGYAGAYNNLGDLLRRLPGRGAEAEAALREALRLQPGHAGTHLNLGALLEDLPGRVAEAEAEYRAALRIRPDFAEAHNNLGKLLTGVPGRYAEGVAELREALRLRPDLPEAHLNLGNRLAGLPGQAAESEAHYRAALRSQPGSAAAHSALANLLGRDPRLAAEAEAEAREAVRLEPGDPVARLSLGAALAGRPGRGAEAEAEYRAALRLHPDFAEAHNNLANRLKEQPGREAEAEGEYRAALRLRPEFAEARFNFGLLLTDLGRYTEALAELRRALSLGAGRPGWGDAVGPAVRRAERLAALGPRLPRLLSGQEAPTPAELSDLVDACRGRRLYAAAARFAAAGLAAGEPPAGGFRYDAACASALAAAGGGADAATAKLRSSLRRQAFEWLSAELAASTGGRARQGLRQWRQDPDLAAVRDPAALARLPVPERREWLRLWAEVDVLLADPAGEK